MSTREDRLLDAIGGVSDRNVRIAVGSNSSELGLRTETHHITLTGQEKITPEEIRRYRIRSAVVGCAAAVLVIAGGIFLWNKLKDIETEPKPAVSTTAAVTTVAPVTAAPADTTDGGDYYRAVEGGFSTQSSTVGGRFLRVVCDNEEFVYTEPDGITRFYPEQARVELVDETTGSVTAEARFVTYDDLVTLDRDIMIKLAVNGSGEYTGLVITPTEDGRYCATVYTCSPDGLMDFDPSGFYLISSPDDVSFEKQGDGIFVKNGEASGHYSVSRNFITYDDNTPYPFLARGRDINERSSGEAQLRFDALIIGGQVLAYSYDNGGTMPTYDIYPEYASLRLNGYEPDKSSGMYYVRSDEEDTGASVQLRSSDENGIGWVELDIERFDANGSFNMITNVLESGRVLIFVGVPLNRRFIVYTCLYDSSGLHLLPDLIFETELPLESIYCDGGNGVIYNDIYKGEKNVVIDFYTLEIFDRTNEECEAAKEKLKELTSGNAEGGFHVPIAPDKGLHTLRYDGEKFTADPDGWYGTVYSITAGTVEKVGYAKGYGNYMQIRDSSGHLWTYANLYYNRYFREGDTVHMGEAISDVSSELAVYCDKEIVPEPLTNPMIIPDESEVTLIAGEPKPSDELHEFSADNTITRRFIGWADEWAATHDDQYRWYKAGEFLDNLGVDGLKELYYKGKFLAGELVTDDFSDIDGYNGVTSFGTDPLHADGAVFELPYPEGSKTMFSFYSSGFSYRSFYDAWMSVFTEEWAFTLLNSYPGFRKYGDELYYVSSAGGGDLSLVNVEYELVKQTEDEIVFNAVGYHVEQGEQPVYDPALRDRYKKTYIPYRFVKTANGWRIAFSETFYNWH
ncbi:MAG: M23 family metallopeptidase [Ruminiclostridium sp.]|nr:M23 family metallopeptidase [Ruminiclostridium sp.]